MVKGQEELVFLPLGGVGEIGMNAALYGFGPEKGRKWIMVDCGMGFAGEEQMPGVDLMFPDLSFIEERRKDLLGIFITHAHEDHIGAISELWPRLKAPVYATRFAKNLLERPDLLGWEAEIAFWDERLSTSAVERFMIGEADMTRKRRDEVVDKMAAAYILQGALDMLANQRRLAAEAVEDEGEDERDDDYDRD